MRYPIEIFVLPVLDRYIVYNPLNGKFALLNQSGVLLLKDMFSKNTSHSPSAEFSELADILSSPGVKHPERTGTLDPQFLGIIPSRNCNMTCAYCDFGAHQNDNEKLDAGQMTAAIDWFAGHRKKNRHKTLPIQFFGGEPFIEEELIDIAVHHTRFLASRIGLVPRFEALSNGYYGETRRRFIKDYFDRVIISLDGFKTYHDRTRAASASRSSFEKVVETVKYFSGQNIHLSIRCCITSESVQQMEEIAAWFCHEFRPDRVNFETLMENALTREAGLLPPDPYEFAKHCFTSWRILQENGVKPAYAPVALDHPQTTSCPVGRDVMIVHPGGMIASCYVQEKDWLCRKMDLSVGELKDDRVCIDGTKMLAFRNQLDDKPRCKNCFCRFGCAGGCHVNNTFPGSSPDYVDFCIHTRIITICRLLEEMDERNHMVHKFLNSKTDLKRMALQKSDRLIHFEE